MTLIECLLACLGLLLTPGPTNTLLALASASDGRRRAARLIPAEVLGYGVSVVPLMLFGQALIAAFPAAATVLQLAAAAWVAFLALKLWHIPQGGPRDSGVTRRKVFLTTMLNPKGVLFGLFLLPGVQDLAPAVVLPAFGITVAAAGCFWIGLGMLVTGRTGRLRRMASVVLGALSVLLLQSGIAAAF
ncbi:hypothetical protein ACFQXB_08540 [Plastorhodobacter daqingensis]|uniref:Threonine transporter RhtB n=1 Tax=Plastorhodobacter daqingensis TaxID=1387281 RepID=A0ABW2UHU4_9RHOB